MLISLEQDIISLVEQYPKYAWILHDKDINEDTGDLEDKHYHIYLEFPNPRSISAIAEELNIDSDMIEALKNKRGIIARLINSDSEDDCQYDISEIHSNVDINLIENFISMMVILKLLDECSTLEEFVAELTKRELVGNPLTNYYNCIKVWQKKRLVKDDDFVSGIKKGGYNGNSLKNFYECINAFEFRRYMEENNL